MTIHTIPMPDLGEGIAEVELVEWQVRPGDVVVEDQILCNVMTDKAAQLAGMASVTIEHRKGASIEEALEFQKAVRERIKATQTVIEAEVC